MKKILIFILFLALLIVAEYYFLTEIFSQKRIPVIAGSLTIILLCIYGFMRFFKKSVLSSERV